MTVKNLKSGALIAIAAGSLFASACKKDNPAPAAPAAPAQDMPADPAAQPAAAQPTEAAMPAEGAAVSGEENTAQVDCSGVNACKGQGSCKTASHGCGGQNACKGQGVVTMSEQDCKAKGGTVAATK